MRKKIFAYGIMSVSYTHLIDGITIFITMLMEGEF